ncbi:NAD-dependent epimerase/dehydratase family protein [Flavobacterium sp. JP2137]|uniref:NAD-dependent epimerase/dehydratase family protein n=1 Tax=Flavobacterium sp. JP2137 TaxID=3414510 RepID=UPI003D2FF34B
MKITITGATGFVGQNLAAFLTANKHQITALSMREKAWLSKLDLQSDAIIHLAGKAHDLSSATDSDAYFKVNTMLTQQLFDAFVHSDITDFFYFSSVKAVADSVNDVLEEEVIPQPLTPYGQSKQRAEQYLLKQVLPEGKRLFIIRPCMIHGPGNKGNLNLLYKIVQRGIPWPLAAFENKRSFLSIDNLNFLVLQLLENRKVTSDVFNFSDDLPLSTNELVALIAEHSDKKPRLWSINKRIVNTVAIVGDKLRLPLNTERLKKLTENYVVSNLKVKRALSIENLPYTAVAGLEKTIRSFR